MAFCQNCSDSVNCEEIKQYTEGNKIHLKGNKILGPVIFLLVSRSPKTYGPRLCRCYVSVGLLQNRSALTIWRASSGRLHRSCTAFISGMSATEISFFRTLLVQTLLVPSFLHYKACEILQVSLAFQLASANFRSPLSEFAIKNGNVLSILWQLLLDQCWWRYCKYSSVGNC